MIYNLGIDLKEEDRGRGKNINMHIKRCIHAQLLVHTTNHDFSQKTSNRRIKNPDPEGQALVIPRGVHLSQME